MKCTFDAGRRRVNWILSARQNRVDFRKLPLRSLLSGCSDGQYLEELKTELKDPQ